VLVPVFFVLFFSQKSLTRYLFACCDWGCQVSLTVLFCCHSNITSVHHKCLMTGTLLHVVVVRKIKATRICLSGVFHFFVGGGENDKHASNREKRNNEEK